MKQRMLSFQQVVDVLSGAKIPCILKEYSYENGDTRFSVEFGFNWPEELMGDVEAAFAAIGYSVPSNMDFCGDSCGPDMIARKKIAGGQKDYLLWR
jgi:hypothetical protein